MNGRWALAGGAGVATAGAATVALYRYGPERLSFVSEEVVEAPRCQVFAACTDVMRWPDYWQFEALVTPPDDDLGMGSSFTFAEPDGSEVSVTVTDWAPCERCSFQFDVDAQGLSQDATFVLTELGDTTRVELFIDLRATRGLNRMTMAAMYPVLRYYYFPTVLRRMKAAAEEG